MHELAEVQDTPSMLFPSEPDGLGVVWIFQDGLAAGEPAANPAPVAASAVPASTRTDPMARATETTTAVTAKRLTPAGPPLRDSMVKSIFPPHWSVLSLGLPL